MHYEIKRILNSAQAVRSASVLCISENKTCETIIILVLWAWNFSPPCMGKHK